MNWALFQRLWRSRWTIRVTLVLVIVGVATGLWWSGLWEEALAFLARYALALVFIVGAAIAILVVPKRQVRRLAITQKERFELENEARKTAAQVVGGAAFLVGLYFTAETLRVNQEGQITERYTKAIEQLGSAELQVRLGGIYALERIARDSERDRGPIMEVLTAYVRVKAPRGKQPECEPYAGPGNKKPASDIQAILTVVGRRPPLGLDQWGREQRLDLSETDLQGANLAGGDLRGAGLERAELQGANLVHTRLQEASLSKACLGGALLHGTRLQGAYLHRADLEKTQLSGARLQGANLDFANLNGALLLRTQLEGASLLGATNITQRQINIAITDEKTRCPADLKCTK